MKKRILFLMGHPAHVHLFKNTIWNLENDKNKVKITVMDKEIVTQLLDCYGFDYDIVGRNVAGLLNKALNLIKVDLKLFKIVKKFNPDILVSTGSPYLAHVSKLIGKPHISFGDTEIDRIGSFLATPFTAVECNPSCYMKKKKSEKQVKYNGYHELAYLHPNYFKPNKEVLEYLELNINDKFIILRISSKSSSHDKMDKGILFKTYQEIFEFVKTYENYGQVFITSEIKLASDFDEYKLTISPENIHSLLFFATMYIGDGATMASESAVLGTPAIFISKTNRGYLNDLEKRYDLVYTFSDQKHALEKVINLLETKNLKSIWQKKRQKLLSEKIDVTEFMTNFIENYPESFYAQRKKNKEGNIE